MLSVINVSWKYHSNNKNNDDNIFSQKLFIWLRNSESFIKNGKGERDGNHQWMDKANWKSPLLICIDYKQWWWTHYLGKVQVNFGPCNKQAHRIWWSIIQQMCSWCDSTEEMASTWLVVAFETYIHSFFIRTSKIDLKLAVLRYSSIFSLNVLKLFLLLQWLGSPFCYQLCLLLQSLTLLTIWNCLCAVNLLVL